MAEADSIPTGEESPEQSGAPTAVAVIELPPAGPGEGGAAAVESAPAAAEAPPADGAEPAKPAEAEAVEAPAEPRTEENEAGEPERELEAEEPVREPRPGALALLKLEKVDTDEAYRLRPEGEVDSLATSMARLGQLFPIDLRIKPPDRFQVICGFRRVAALRLLKRERVLARVHTDLNDEDALRLALADLLEHEGRDREGLESLKARLESEHRLTPPVKQTLERALAPVEEALGPEEVEGQGGEEEVDLDELAQDITRRLAGINQDLALVTELWSAMEPSLRRALLDQLTYPEQLAAYLRGL